LGCDVLLGGIATKVDEGLKGDTVSAMRVFQRLVPRSSLHLPLRLSPHAFVSGSRRRMTTGTNQNNELNPYTATVLLSGAGCAVVGGFYGGLDADQGSVMFEIGLGAMKGGSMGLVLGAASPLLVPMLMVGAMYEISVYYRWYEWIKKEKKS